MEETDIHPAPVVGHQNNEPAVDRHSDRGPGVLSEAASSPSNKKIRRPRLSCVLVVYNMRREAERTLLTLSPAYQKNVAEDDYEVIVVENGSSKPIDSAYVARFGKNFRFCKAPIPHQSPAGALNYGVSISRGDIVVGMIDGARMASPGCIFWTMKAFDTFGDIVAIVPSWHLGPDVQNESVTHGYNQTIEDELLASVDWQTDGYKLFKLCERLDPSSEGAAWFQPVSESNFIAVSRRIFERLGGFEERFTSPGGGAVNLDFFKRAAEETGCKVVNLLGEGTFHQFHGGITTNIKTKEHPWEKIKAEYAGIRNCEYKIPEYKSLTVGALTSDAIDFLARSPNIFTSRPGRRLPGRYDAWLYFLLSALFKAVRAK